MISNNNPLVSVIIPTYNCPHFLREAVDSALNQTYSNREVIIVDDGSTDNTPEVVREYGDRVRYIRQNNSGTAAARNTGIRNAKGELIAFLDHDDVWLPRKLELQVPYLADESIGLVYTAVSCFDANTGEELFKWFNGLSIDVHDILSHRIRMFFLQSAVMRRNIFDRVGMLDETLKGTDDWDIFIRIAASYRLVGIPDILLRTRSHPGHQGKDTETMYFNSLKVLRKHNAIHNKCIFCKQAIRECRNFLREYSYQAMLKNARAAFHNHANAVGLNLFIRAIIRNPIALARIPRFIFRRFKLFCKDDRKG